MQEKSSESWGPTLKPGLVTLDDQIHDAYLVSDTAKFAKISLLSNIRLCDFSITTQAPLSTSNLGLSYFRFIHNLQLQRLEAHDAYGAGTVSYTHLTLPTIYSV